MDPYYEPHGGIVLSRPIALIGFWGSRIPEIAVAVSQMSGIPFLDIERNIEHSIGMSLYKYGIQQGQEGIVKMETKVLSKALSSAALPPIIALRPESFSNEANRNYILKQCDTIYVQKNIFLLFSQILSVLDRKERHRNVFIPVSDARDITQVASCLREYEQGYMEAHRVLSVERSHPLKIANQLLQELQ